MPRISESIDVDVPVQAAYNQWTQFETFPNFMNGVEEINQLDDLRSHWKTKVGGLEREFDTEIVEQIPDTAIAWSSLDGRSHSGRVSFEAKDITHCRVTVNLDWEAEGMTERIGAAVGADDRQVRSDLKPSRSTSRIRATPTAAGAAPLSTARRDRRAGSRDPRRSRRSRLRVGRGRAW